MGTKLLPIHPGEVLAEDFMAPRGLTANQLALDLRVPANRLSEVIRGRRSIKRGQCTSSRTLLRDLGGTLVESAV